MTTIKYEMQVPKEGKEIVDALTGIIEKVVAKAPLAEYVELFGELSRAVDGVEKVGEEIKSEFRDELAGYMTHKIMGSFWTPKKV